MTGVPVSDDAIDDFRREARAWLAQRLEPRGDAVARGWGVGTHDVSVFHDLDPADERERLDAELAWQAAKVRAGYGALSWPVEHGGRGLDPRFTAAFAAEESAFAAPMGHELVSVTVRLVAPALLQFGTPEQQAGPMRAFLGGEQLCCQLFSEPGAGSDLAALATRARRVDGRWIISGQKIWSSGAHFAQFGLLLARTDPDVAKHAGITAFLLPLDTPGVDVRPIRQMTGGASFCEVYLDDVVLDDDAAVGEVGGGWAVTMAVLGFERESSDGSGDVGGSWEQVHQLAVWAGAYEDPLLRQKLARTYTRHHLNQVTRLADAERRARGESLGATGSLRKLQWVGLLREVSDTVTAVLGDRLAADTGEWGTFSWNDHVLGSLGYSIAGGTDEVQRSIVAERLLGLPQDPRVDKGLPWSKVPR
jgi:alkylation response protein AidB-like acyl-CoA dehydrogenase